MIIPTDLIHHIEALIFSVESSISLEEIQACILKAFEFEINKEELGKFLLELEERHADSSSVFELARIHGGYQFLTKPHYSPLIQTHIQFKNQKKLSNAAMETLAIISYKQPITKSEIEDIRGVNCDYSIQKLLERELIQIDGKSEGPGRPLIYSTSKTFMDYFKLDSLNQLPQLKDLASQSPI